MLVNKRIDGAACRSAPSINRPPPGRAQRGAPPGEGQRSAARLALPHNKIEGPSITMPGPRIRRAARRMLLKRRKPMMRRRAGALRRQVHSFKRLVSFGTVTASQSPATGTIPVRTAISFPLNLVPNSTEYTALYDQYRINAISFRAVPKASQFQGGTSGSANPLGYGQVISVIDYDDSTTPVTKDSLMEYGSVKFTRSSSMHKRYFKPKILQRAQINAVTDGNVSAKATWIDTLNPDVQHYGIKLFIDAPTVPNVATDSSSISYDLYAVYYMTFKNTR